MHFSKDKVVIHICYYQRSTTPKNQNKLNKSLNIIKQSRIALFKKNLRNNLLNLKVRITRKRQNFFNKYLHKFNKLPRFYKFNISKLNTIIDRASSKTYNVKPIVSRTHLTRADLKNLAILLSKLMALNVELEVVRLKYPYHDTDILAKLIGVNGNTMTYGRIKKLLFDKATIFSREALNSKGANTNNQGLINIAADELDENNSNSVSNESQASGIASQLIGLKFRISGRLARQRVVPKKTVKTAYKGGISKSKNNIVDCSTFTSKNKKGAFSIRV